MASRSTSKQPERPRWFKVDKYPEWFDVRKYAVPSWKLDAKGWLYQISARLTMEVYWHPPVDDEYFGGKSDPDWDYCEPNDWEKTAAGLWGEIQQHGVLPLPPHHPDGYPDEGEWHGTTFSGYSAVRTLTNWAV